MISITQDIFNWSKKFLEKPNKHLGGMPVCPYAKKARVDGKLKVVEVDSSEKFLKKVIEICDNFGVYDVVIVACEDMEISADELHDYVHALNHVYVPKDVYLIASYPDDEQIDFLESLDYEPAREFYMVLIQSYQKLEDGSSSLSKTNYYKHWPEDYYADTVLLRKKYRR